MEVGGGTEESSWNDEWRWVEGQRRAHGMMNGGGGTKESLWNGLYIIHSTGSPLHVVGSEAIDFHAYSTSCPPAL